MGPKQDMLTKESRQSGDFFQKLSPAAQKDFASLQIPMHYPVGRVLFSEQQAASGVYVVLDGEVKLSINSSEGKRLSLRIVHAGEVLGLTSALSGGPFEMTAEALHAARIAPIGRREFLGFLMRHPEAYQIVTEAVSAQFNMACQQLRTMGLASTAPERLARLLLEWSERGQMTEHGTRFRFSLRHEEIGEFIGASRETVTRTLTTFKLRGLVALNGSTLTIPNRSALESYARC
jgi:CRP/FNR family transcriptional regulator